METVQGHVRNGVVVLDSGPALPDGLAVTVSFQTPVEVQPAPEKQRVQLPLVRTGEPGSLHLTNARIAEIFDEEDVASARR